MNDGETERRLRGLLGCYSCTVGSGTMFCTPPGSVSQLFQKGSSARTTLLTSKNTAPGRGRRLVQQCTASSSSDGQPDGGLQTEHAPHTASSDGGSNSSDDVWEYEAPDHVQQRNQQFIDEQLAGRVILAPLTKGGNLPFRWGSTSRSIPLM